MPVLVFDTCVFCAALYKGVQQFRSGSLKDSRLMQILLRDSLVYFIMSVLRLRHALAHVSHSGLSPALMLWLRPTSLFGYAFGYVCCTEIAGGSHTLGLIANPPRCDIQLHIGGCLHPRLANDDEHATGGVSSDDNGGSF